MGWWRRRPAREPEAAQALGLDVSAPVSGPVMLPDAWAEVCEQFAWRLLVLTEQMRPVLDVLESGERDPDCLARLYEVDHGVTRMRRVARDLRVLAGRGGEEIAGHASSLLDVVRMAASAIEHYGRVSAGPVAELAVVAYAADDMASVLAALADNATRYSPSMVTVSAHLLADGSVMVRVEDGGLGMEPGWLAALNGTLAGPVPPAGVAGRHTGFEVVRRLARRHGLRVQLARRDPPGPGAGGNVTGTIAMVGIPPALVCEIPGPAPAAGERVSGPPSPAGSLPAWLPARRGPDPVVPPHRGPGQGPAGACPAASRAASACPRGGSGRLPGRRRRPIQRRAGWRSQPTCRPSAPPWRPGLRPARSRAGTVQVRWKDTCRELGREVCSPANAAGLRLADQQLRR